MLQTRQTSPLLTGRGARAWWPFPETVNRRSYLGLGSGSVSAMCSRKLAWSLETVTSYFKYPIETAWCNLALERQSRIQGQPELYRKRLAKNKQTNDEQKKTPHPRSQAIFLEWFGPIPSSGFSRTTAFSWGFGKPSVCLLPTMTETNHPAHRSDRTCQWPLPAVPRQTVLSLVTAVPLRKM